MKNFFSRAGKSVLAVAVVSAPFLTSCEKEPLAESEALSPDTPSAGAMFANSQGPNYVAKEVLVKFKAGTNEEIRTAVLARIGANVKERIVTKTMETFGDKEGLTLVTTPMAALEAINRLQGMAEIEFAEPNFIYTHDATSDDPYYTDGSLWGMYGSTTTPANEFGSQAGAAWANGNTGSSNVVIGVIDEGVMYFHEDLEANMWKNPGEIADNGVDDDGNGYVDDVYGWDFDGNDNSTYDGSQDDHGTHVAGTIGAMGGNGTGVVGVNWNVKMITAKFLGRRGGTTANAIKSVDYITDLKSRHGLNLVATNNSWGGGGYSQGLYDAIERANTASILFMAAAGNGGGDGVGDDTDTDPHYPSSYQNTNIISVASITKDGSKSGFSNFGLESVDLGAPGSGIFSTLPSKQDNSTYGSYSGTSMATPHVAGAAALYAAATGASGSTLKQAIMDNTIPTSSLEGKCVTGGRLDVSTF
jgi:subtilisin family serine protease